MEVCPYPSLASHLANLPAPDSLPASRKGTQLPEAIQSLLMKSKDDPKFPCPFCQRTYRKKTHYRHMVTTINCQLCLVDVYFNEIAGMPPLLAVHYRLHDKMYDSMMVDFGKQETQVFLYPKQRKYKKPFPQLIFKTARLVKPSQALAQADRLVNLWVFS
jgi:hypothetical protein